VIRRVMELEKADHLGPELCVAPRIGPGRSSGGLSSARSRAASVGGQAVAAVGIADRERREGSNE